MPNWPKKSGLSAAKVEEILKFYQEPVSIEMPVGENGDGHLGDLIEDKFMPSPPDTVVHQWSQRTDRGGLQEPER